MGGFQNRKTPVFPVKTFKTMAFGSFGLRLIWLTWVKLPGGRSSYGKRGDCDNRMYVHCTGHSAISFVRAWRKILKGKPELKLNLLSSLFSRGLLCFLVIGFKLLF